MGTAYGDSVGTDCVGIRPQRRGRLSINGSAMNIDAIAREARQFADAGQRCLADFYDGVSTGPMEPGVVCTALAIEMWFKAFHCMAFPDKPIPGGHDLFKLFQALPDATQDKLIARSHASSDWFHRCLEEDARVFETWRYTYERWSVDTEKAQGAEPLSVSLLVMRTLAGACEEVYADLATERPAAG